MLVGWGGNNGSTVTAATIANKLNMSWYTKEGTQVCNFKTVLSIVSNAFGKSRNSGDDKNC